MSLTLSAFSQSGQLSILFAMYPAGVICALTLALSGAQLTGVRSRPHHERPGGPAARLTLPHQHWAPVPPTVNGNVPKSIGRTRRPSGPLRPGGTAEASATANTKPVIDPPG